MKNTSIVIPIILIACLSALGYLFYKALQTVDEDRNSGNNRITLREADYADEPTPEDVGATTDYEAIAPPPATPAAPDEDPAPSSNALTEMTEAEKRAAEQEELAEAARLAREEEARRTANATEEDSAETAADTDDTATEPSGSGRYLVIAGSFRQRSGAEDRVAKLRKAGFKETTLERFNRGTFAVALAGQSDRYSEANNLAKKIRAAGFEAEVMRRR
ncbi:MAG: SPOR domain-containing protein [Bacteroidota bacterium]